MHQPVFQYRAIVLLVFALSVSIYDLAPAQDGSLFVARPAHHATLTLEQASPLFRELPPESRPRELGKNDIITVIVDVRSRFLSEGDAETRKVASFAAALTDWIRIDGGSIKPAPQSDGDPTITGNLNSQYRAESDIELRDSLTFRIGAKIVDIRPNGNLVIEAHQEVRNNEERWRISLSGVVRREAIQADRTVSSDAITELFIDKQEIGQVHDGYSRGWLGRLYDRYRPF